MSQELLLLKIRNAIADKEATIAYANMQTAKAGGWTCDWSEEIHLTSIRIDAMIKEAEKFEAIQTKAAKAESERRLRIANDLAEHYEQLHRTEMRL